jgi:tetratricopeptide (TPR) repeat protein
MSPRDFGGNIMRAWIMLLPLVALVPAAAGDARSARSPDDLVAGLPICGDEAPPPAKTELLPGYGSGGFPITTVNPRAQAFFDNGMQLAHAFAHQAATAAFAEAARADLNCAMCQWGEAWSLGPTINFPISPDEQKAAAAKVAVAERLIAARTPERERDLISALKLRYADGGGKGPGDIAFARAMDTLADRYPADDEIATIAADAWMIPAALNNVTSKLDRSVELLERVLRRNPTYTPAIHFYIHATEMRGFPKRAERYANALPALAARSSHLIHMPSHTFYWIGRYQDAADVNVQAAGLGLSDARIAGMTKAGAEWDQPYHGHNVQFGIGGAMLSGDAKDALALSGPLLVAAAKGPTGNAFMEMVMGTGYAAQGRFGLLGDVIALPDPGDKRPYARAYWRYARGEAQARAGNAVAVRAEAAAIVVPIDTGKNDASKQARQLVLIAQAVLAGRAAMIDRDYASAAAAFLKAAELEEAPLLKDFSDPPVWWYPTRRSYAAALLMQGNARAAIAQTRLVLARRPSDPVTLSLQARAERRLGRNGVAARDLTLSKRGWRGGKAELDPRIA